jgi:hypothetical protein
VAKLAKMKKIGLAERGRSLSNSKDLGRKVQTGPAGETLLAILLDAGGAQTGQTVLIDGKLPGQEFIDRQGVAAAGLLKGEQTTADGGNDFGFTANNPPFGSGCRQIRDCQGTAVRPDDVFYPRAMGFCHGVLTNSQPLNSQEQTTCRGLKFA